MLGGAKWLKFVPGLMGGYLISVLGRHGTMYGTTVAFALFYLLMAGAETIIMILVGRFLTGVASGVTSIAAPVYIAETSSASVRGMLGSCFQVSFYILSLCFFLSFPKGFSAEIYPLVSLLGHGDVRCDVCGRGGCLWVMAMALCSLCGDDPGLGHSPVFCTGVPGLLVIPKEV